MFEEEFVDENPDSAVVIPDGGYGDISIDVVMVREDFFGALVQSYCFVYVLGWDTRLPEGELSIDF
jgi:hypothetical protein